MRKGILDFGADGGTLTVSTEKGKTHLSWSTVHGRMYGIASNTSKTRRFLRSVLLRMEKEAKKGK